MTTKTTTKWQFIKEWVMDIFTFDVERQFEKDHRRLVAEIVKEMRRGR